MKKELRKVEMKSLTGGIIDPAYVRALEEEKRLQQMETCSVSDRFALTINDDYSGC